MSKKKINKKKVPFGTKKLILKILTKGVQT